MITIKNKLHIVFSMTLLQGANVYGAAADVDTASNPGRVVATPSAELSDSSSSPMSVYTAATAKPDDKIYLKLKRKATAAALTNAGAGALDSSPENPHRAPATKRSCHKEGIHGDVGTVSPTLESDVLPAPSTSAAAPVLTHQDWSRLGEECYRANHYAQALVWFDKIMENPYYIAAQSTGVLCHMGGTYRRYEQYSKAIRCYAQAIAKQGGLQAVQDTALLYNAGICNFHQSMQHIGTDKHTLHIDNALTLLTQCLKRQEKSVFTPDEMAHNTPRYAIFLQSITTLDRTIEQKQNAGKAVDPMHLVTAGLAYYQVSKYAEAAHHLESAIAVQRAAGAAIPSTYLFTAGVSNSMLENYDKAAVFFDMAITQVPIQDMKDIFILGTMAQTYAVLDKIETATSVCAHYYGKVGSAHITQSMWPYIAHHYFGRKDYLTSLRLYSHYFKIMSDTKVPDTMHWAIREAIAARHMLKFVDKEGSEKPKAPRIRSPLAPPLETA